MKKPLILLFLLSFYVITKASDNGVGIRNMSTTTAKEDKKEIPGGLIFDIGFQFLSDAPDDMNLHLWGSKTVRLYYMKDLKLGGKVSLMYGMGLGLDRYSWSGDITLAGVGDSTSVVQLRTGGGFATDTDYLRSKLATNFVDIPIELKYHSNDDPKKGFSLALGGTIGFLFDAHTKYKVEESGEKKTFKEKQSFNLNKIRYGLQGRLGVGGFNVFYYYGLSELFETDKGPEQTTAAPSTIGISFLLF